MFLVVTLNLRMMFHSRIQYSLYVSYRLVWGFTSTLSMCATVMVSMANMRLCEGKILYNKYLNNKFSNV